MLLCFFVSFCYVFGGFFFGGGGGGGLICFFCFVLFFLSHFCLFGFAWFLIYLNISFTLSWVCFCCVGLFWYVFVFFCLVLFCINDVVQSQKSIKPDCSSLLHLSQPSTLACKMYHCPMQMTVPDLHNSFSESGAKNYTDYAYTVNDANSLWVNSPLVFSLLLWQSETVICGV